MYTSTKDPVCGMTVPPDSTYRYVHQDITYLFCSPACLAKFRAAFSEFARPKIAEGGITYGCPRHPEIMMLEPGKCPKCWMELKQK